MTILGIMACPRCGGEVTAWQMNAATGRFFEVDDIDPYLPHRCDPLVMATLRQAAAMERLAAVTEERNAERDRAAVSQSRRQHDEQAAERFRQGVQYTGPRQLTEGQARPPEEPLADKLDW